MIGQRDTGFTIPELLVAIAVSSIVALGTIGLYITIITQVPVMTARNTMSTNLQNALNRISDDIRLSSNVGLYNVDAPDANAPTTLAGSYADVPGPTDQQYNWRMGPHRLILNQTPLTATGTAIYDGATPGIGKRNSIIYYIAGGALWRRVVAAPYGNNILHTTTCSPVPDGGCATGDIKVIDNLDPSLGDAAFTVTYYDKPGNPIANTKVIDTSTGATAPDYSLFPLTRAIDVKLSLRSTTLNNQSLTLSNSRRMVFRSQVPESTTVKPTVNWSAGGLIVGPGGLSVTANSTVGTQAIGSVYVKGGIDMQTSSAIGTAAQPINLMAANGGCYSGSTWQTCGTQPISLSGGSYIYGDVCATGQTTKTWTSPTSAIKAGTSTYTHGLIASCVVSNFDLPTFDKAGFATSMTASKSASDISISSSDTKSTTPNATYSGDVTVSAATLKLTGNAYITGTFTATVGAVIQVDESVGTNRPIIVVNGPINFTAAATVKPNSYGTTPYFVSYHTKDTTCQNSATCVTAPASQVYANVNDASDKAITVTLSSNLSGSAVYAVFGIVSLDTSSTVGSVAGQRVTVSNAAKIPLNGS